MPRSQNLPDLNLAQTKNENENENENQIYIYLYINWWMEWEAKTINSADSLVVTHPTTKTPAYGLSTAELTGSPVFHILWSIAKERCNFVQYIDSNSVILPRILS